jgi:hypothetical protein
VEEEEGTEAAVVAERDFELRIIFANLSNEFKSPEEGRRERE